MGAGFVARIVTFHPVGSSRAALSVAAAMQEIDPLLSPRERDVLALLVEGLSDREIADRLTISARTVHSHIASARAKLQARSRTHLAVLGLCAGFVRCPACVEGRRELGNPPHCAQTRRSARMQTAWDDERREAK